MKKITMTLLAAALMLLPMPRTLSQQKANQSFGFNAASIKGFPIAEAFLTVVARTTRTLKPHV